MGGEAAKTKIKKQKKQKNPATLGRGYFKSHTAFCKKSMEINLKT